MPGGGGVSPRYLPTTDGRVAQVTETHVTVLDIPAACQMRDQWRTKLHGDGDFTPIINAHWLRAADALDVAIRAAIYTPPHFRAVPSVGEIQKRVGAQ